MKPTKQIMDIGSFVSKKCAFLCNLTFLPASLYSMKQFHCILTTCLGLDMFNSQALVCNFSVLFEVREALPSPVLFCAFFVLVIINSASNNNGDGRRFSGLLEDDDIMLCLHRLFCLSSRVLPLFLVLSVASLRSFTSIDESDTDGQVGGDGSEGACSFPIFLHVCVSFSILAQINFATMSTKQDGVRARVLKASLHVKDLVHFSNFH